MHPDRQRELRLLGQSLHNRLSPQLLHHRRVAGLARLALVEALVRERRQLQAIADKK